MRAQSTALDGVARPARPGARKPPLWLGPTAAVATVLVAWELLSRSGVLPERHVPSMTESVEALLALLQTAGFWTAVGDTLQGWAIGLGIAIAAAVPVGIAVGSSRLVYQSLRVVIEFLRPIPSVALIPLAVLIYGTGLESKVFLVTFACFWPVFMQTLYGVHAVDPVASDTARAFGLGRLERTWRITLPGAVPYIATGIRISSAVALILAVTAELVIGAHGLGREISLARANGALEDMYALIIVTGIIGWTLNACFRRAERRVLHWHPTHRTVIS